MFRHFHGGSTGSNPVRSTNTKSPANSGFLVYLKAFLTKKQRRNCPRIAHGSIILCLFIAVYAMPESSIAAGNCTHFATPKQAIKCVFPKHLQATAWRIAKCESTADAPEHIARIRGLGRWAKSGQYVGIFQMGYRERKHYGFYRRGASALIQTRSAYKLYQDRGFQPWSCFNG